MLCLSLANDAHSWPSVIHESCQHAAYMSPVSMPCGDHALSWACCRFIFVGVLDWPWIYKLTKYAHCIGWRAVP